MREKEQIRETKFPVNRLLPCHGRSALTLPSQEVVQFMSGERGCVIEQTLQRDQGATSAGCGLGWDWDGEKNVVKTKSCCSVTHWWFI